MNSAAVEAAVEALREKHMLLSFGNKSDNHPGVKKGAKAKKGDI